MSDIIGKYLGRLLKQEQPSGSVNGSNVLFSLNELPASSNCVFLTVDGIFQKQGSGLDYTVSGDTITMEAAPSLGQKLYVFYIKAD